MIRTLLVASLAAGPLSMPASPPETEPELAIRAITVRPEEPVVGAYDSIRLVIDVVAKGTRGKDGVSVKVEPGAPPRPVLDGKPDDESLDKPPAPSPTPSPSVTRSVVLTPSAEIPSAPDTGAQRAINVGVRPVAPALAQVAGQATGPLKTARVADGWETWRFLPDKRLNRYYPTGTWTITATAKGPRGATVTEYASFQLRRATRLSSVMAEKAGRSGAVRLSGSLRRVDPRGYTGYGPFAKQPLEILWRPDESTAWDEAGQATTDASGAFETTISGRTGGFWRVHYPGTGHYAPDSSKSQQITQ
ncbi:hypothetical protein [Nonomuraea sp. NPDC049784]|uniref:hypothetical protein n=1 Tax=Nonomuraea sp. NPDC049784 TaxID=3154361 RepID=UPI003404DB58